MTQPPPISAAQQFKAIAYLRWRLFANGFRRKGGKGELVARIIIFPFAFFLLFGVISGAGAGAYAAASSGHLEYLSAIFWGIFSLQILISIQISAPGLSFDPAALIRFPLNFRRYLLVRIFLGLLSASTVAGTCALLAAAAGIAIAIPALALTAFATALGLAITNMLFTRMVFAWVDRWLSTRRAREFLTAFFIVFSIAIQYANVTYNGIGRHQSQAEQAAKIATAVSVYHWFSPALHALPPGLAGQALQGPNPLLDILGILAFATLFLAIFAWRMQREYRGENLSEVSHQPTPAPTARVPHSPVSGLQPATPSMSGTTNPTPTQTKIPPALAALLTKEWTYMRRNPAQYYGLLAPLAMVFLFAARMGRFGASGFIFPAAAAYSMLGVSALAYNILGMDANGIQFYFLSPVPFRTVFLSKNLFSFAIPAVQVVLIYALMVFTVGAPGLVITLSVIAWILFATIVNVTVGNLRSITAPKKMDPGKVSRRQASQLSGLIALGIMLAVTGLGFVILLLARALHLSWLPIPIFAALAAGAGALYWAMLARVDAMAVAHRDTLIAELSKVE